MSKTFDAVIDKHGAAAVTTLTALAMAAGAVLKIHPGHVLQLVSEASPEDRAKVRTGRQFLALVMAQHAKGFDAAFAQREAEDGVGPQVDLSCALDLYEAARHESHSSQEDAGYAANKGPDLQLVASNGFLVEGNDTLQ